MAASICHLPNIVSDAQTFEPMQIRHLGLQECAEVWRAMQAFTAKRTIDTPDEIWLVQHPPVFTLGLAGKPEHILQATSIPILPIDRGGQVTYHGPGQLIVYVLLDLQRRVYGVHELVRRLEQAVLNLLAEYGLSGRRRDKAPGVYIADHKIAALGLRVKHARTYHGLALNVDMDLTPFDYINPCGYAGMPITQLHDQGVTENLDVVAARFLPILVACLQAPGNTKT